LQVFVQNRIVSPVVSGAEPTPPFMMRLADWFPLLRRLPARVIGMGFQPEHVRAQ
jgi:hypothetical protein